jgi:hypothetical protein
MKNKVAAALLIASFAMPAYAGLEFLPTLQTEFEHGGGCRKSSPAGQCCHKQTSTNTVHCH